MAFYELVTWTNIINIAIVLMLIYVYAKNFRFIKSKYNIGLLIFSFLFLAENLISLHLSIFQWPLMANEAVVFHMTIINLVELMGLSTLLYITWR